MKNIFLLAILFSTLLLSSCLRMFTPRHEFDFYTPPPPPDYSDEKNWCALPWKKDGADKVPANSNMKDEQDSAKVDVFFIHPTTYYSRKSWNAPLDDATTNKLRDSFPLVKQASVFNGSCRVFAPAYRQATLGTFFQKENSANHDKPLELACSDVFRAFEYYLQHYNNGRPFIIASHSQGSRHAEELLKKYIDGKDLQKQMIAAYVIGGWVKKNSFTHLKIMNAPDETGGVVCWRTMKDKKRTRKIDARHGKQLAIGGTNAAIVNPVSWTTDTLWHEPTTNSGSVPSTFNRVDKNLVTAQVSGNFLYVKRIRKPGYKSRLGSNYHIYDYSLFYLNIRENVKTRIAAWEKKNNLK
jgi:hypothetical protein